jgi:hypothetical protein
MFFVFTTVYQCLYHLSKVAKCMAVGRLPEMDPEIPTPIQELIIQCWNLNPKVLFQSQLMRTVLLFCFAQMYNFLIRFF